MDTERVREEWDRLAPAWERNAEIIARLGAPVSDWLIERLDPRPGETVLELAAGTGDVGSRLAPRLGDDGHLIVSDLSPHMVAAASRRLESLGVTSFEARVLDAQDLELDDASVDAVVCRWGYMLMPRPSRALSETARVLRPGGRLALSVWGRPEANPWIVLPGMVALSTGLLELGDPNEPGGIFSLATPELLSAALEGSWLAPAEIAESPLVIPFDSFERVWTFVTEMLSQVSDALRGAPDQEAVRSQLAGFLEAYGEGTGYAVPGLTLNALLRKA